MLEMRTRCERCGANLNTAEPGSYICSYECTFCATCAHALDLICPNCGGEMTERPVRPSRLPS